MQELFKGYFAGKCADAANFLLVQGNGARKAQLLGQTVVDAALRRVQIRMHADDGQVLPHQVRQKPPQTGVIPEGLHLPLVPADVHHRVMGHDQVRPLLCCLRRHGGGYVQGCQHPADLPVPPAHQQAHIVPALRRFPGSPGIQKGFDVPYRGHFSASFFFSRAAINCGRVPQSAPSLLCRRPSSRRRRWCSCASR